MYTVYFRQCMLIFAHTYFSRIREKFDVLLQEIFSSRSLSYNDYFFNEVIKY